MEQPSHPDTDRIGRVDADGRVRDAFDESADPLDLEEPEAPGTWVLFQVHGGRACRQGDVLAAPESALADLYGLAARRGLSPRYPSAVLEEAAAAVADPGTGDPGLLDLTHLPFVTIDEVHSRDLDQALFVERRDEGYRVWYAIADPAWCVRPGTALFAEALRRGATYYLPGLVIPMLPRELSEGSVSINPSVDRRSMVFEVNLDAAGRTSDFRIHRARVQSRVKTSYDAVQAFFDGQAPVPGGPLPGSAPPADADVISASLELLREVGTLRMELAESRHVIAFRRQEIAVSLAGKEGLRFVAMADPRNDVERYNEQISLLCNVVGARFLMEGDTDEDEVQPIYRVHDPPAPRRLAELADQIEALTGLRRLDAERWRWRPGRRNLADYLRSLPSSGPEARLARAVHRQAMLTGGRSLFSTAPGAHFGVGADVYGRFTAPMREVVGVFAHKETWEKLFGHREAPPPWDDDEALRSQVIEAANQARDTQRKLDREVNGLVLDQLLGDDLKRDVAGRPRRRGTILGVSDSKVHVGLDDPPIDVKVYIHHLNQRTDERVGQGRDRMTLRRLSDGKVLQTVGDEVCLRVVGHAEDRWELEILPPGP